MKTFLIILVLSLLSWSANAVCYLNGKAYPTGTVISGLTCQADGTWK